VEWLKVKALRSSSSTAEKKKKEREKKKSFWLLRIPKHLE
jgi:hypothetical protein